MNKHFKLRIKMVNIMKKTSTTKNILKAGVVAALVLALLIPTSVASPGIGIKPKIIYVDGNNVQGPWDGTRQHPYRLIQDGINHASSGDTIFVFSYTYSEKLVVDKKVILLGENKDTTIISPSGSGVGVLITASQVILRSFTVHPAAVFAGEGIKVVSPSSHDTLMDNVITNCLGYGIFLDQTFDNTIMQNKVFDQQYGIAVASSYNNKVSENDIRVCDGEVGIAIAYEASTGNVVSKNKVTLTDGDQMYSFRGISVWFASSNKIVDNTVTEQVEGDQHFGIILESSPNCSVSQNSLAGAWSLRGIRASEKDIISGNVVKNCRAGIEIGSLCLVLSNTLKDNLEGINIYGSSNTMSKNVVTGGYRGVAFYEASGNSFTENTVTLSQEIGVQLYSSLDNNLYHNNFVNNTQNAFDDGNNSWDSPNGGNYWSDYTGVDLNGDGFGDTPYYIPGGDNLDRLPLMLPHHG
jgi:nitrous oxidase accessory protein